MGLSSCIGTIFLCQRCLDWSGIRELEMENEADEGHRKSVSQFLPGDCRAITFIFIPCMTYVFYHHKDLSLISKSYEDMLIFVHNNHLAFIHSHTFPNRIAYICTKLVL